MLLIVLVKNELGVVFKLFELFVWYGVLMMCFELCLVCVGMWEYYFYIDIEGYCDDVVVVVVLMEFG